jgi:hypothetical protein
MATLRQEAEKIYPPCDHISPDGTSAMWPIGDCEVCIICGKSVMEDDAEEYPMFTVNVPVGG